MCKDHRILIVEDEAIIALSLQESLFSFGYKNVDVVEDAKTAIRFLLTGKYDLVLMDIKLKGDKDGIDVMNTVSKHVDIPFIYITGNSDNKTVSRAKHSLPDGFILKPFTEIDLKINLELVIHRKLEQYSKGRNTNIWDRFTQRERQVLEKLIIGYSNKMIANVLNISHKTVSNHRANILRKTKARNTADLVRLISNSKINP